MPVLIGDVPGQHRFQSGDQSRQVTTSNLSGVVPVAVDSDVGDREQLPQHVLAHDSEDHLVVRAGHARTTTLNDERAV